LNDSNERDPRLPAIPDTHGHAKGEHKPYAEERPLPLTARMLFLWFYHAARRGYPRFLMVADHMNYLTFEDPAAVNLVRRALKLAQAGDLYGAAETANVEVGHAAVVSDGLRRGMRFSIGAEVDNDPRSRPDAQNIVDAMRPDAIIRSVHFVPITHPIHGEGWNWPFDNPEFADLFDVVGTEALWESYIAMLVDAIERLPGHIVGHFYAPAVFGHWPDEAKLEAYEDRVLDAAAARGMAIEFNTRYLYREHTEEEQLHYLAANKRLLRKAKQRGVGIAIGSDAHSPKDQGNRFETVLAVLDDLEINEIVFPLGGALRRVALRVVREPEPEPPAPEVPRPRPEPAAEVEAAKPVRKARPAPKPTRAPERVEHAPLLDAAAPGAAAPAEAVAEPPTPAAAAAAAPASHASARPVAPAPSAPKTAVPKPAPAKRAPAAQGAVKVVSPNPAPNPKAPPKAAKAPVKAAAKPGKTSAKAKPPARKSAPAKSPARGSTKKAGPAKKAAPKKTAPATKTGTKKAAAKRKSAPARVPARKAASPKKAPPKKAAAKKAVPKKAVPARGAPARKTTATKKTVKKTAAKRR